MAISRLQFKAYGAPLGNPHNFDSSVTAGSLLVAIISGGGLHSPPTSISDTSSNAWIGPINFTVTPNATTQCYVTVFYCLSANAGTHPDPQITFSGGDDANDEYLFIEYAGFSSPMVDMEMFKTSANSTTLSPTSDNFTLGGTAEAVVAVYNNQTDTWSTGTPTVSGSFAIMDSNGGAANILADWVAATPQSGATVQFSLSPTNALATKAWQMLVISFASAITGSQNALGIFDSEKNQTEWQDQTQYILGWYDDDLVDAGLNVSQWMNAISAETGSGGTIGIQTWWT